MTSDDFRTQLEELLQTAVEELGEVLGHMLKGASKSE